MVQVSYPGVYIREVPSGARTITGVATAITAFVGMAKNGPVAKPTTILGFTDYARIFGEDTSKGEMTDQVRQFFLNGGRQAIITRIAGGTVGPSGVQLLAATGELVLSLESLNAGKDEDQLRATVDYNTADPERTFNLTLYRELVDASGNASISTTETHRNLSMSASDGRYVETILARDSLLASATVNTANVTPLLGNSVSVSARIEADMDAALVAAVGRNLRVTLDDGQGNVETQVVALTAAPTGAGDIATAINNAFGIGSVTATSATFGTQQVLLLTCTDHNIKLGSASSSDLAAEFGLGVDNGGVEIAREAPARPAANGYVSDISSLSPTDLTRLFTLAGTTRASFATVQLAGLQGFSFNGSDIAFATTGTLMSEGTTSSGTSLNNVRQNLGAIADAINRFTNSWRAEIHGVRLALFPLFGTAESGPDHSFTSAPLSTTDGIFEAAVANAAGAKFGGGDDGGVPAPTDYDAAYTIIDSQVDLFNIMVLPASADNPDRSALWSKASAFCLSRRAFLLVDAADSVRSVAEAGQAVKDLRIGLVKDHSALYWPRVEVNPDGNRRAIDPSGTVAGLMSRIDSNRGVWKAPAGIEADLRGVLAVTTKMSDPENGLLNPLALNALRAFPSGIVSWGSRTMDGFDNSGNDDYKYVPVRRFTLFLEESLYRGLQFAVFEPNAEPLWAQIRLAVGAFLNNLFRQGAFAGETTREAYFVKVDQETTTQNDVNLGIVNVVVGFAPLKPAEFVVVTIKQQAGQIQV